MILSSSYWSKTFLCICLSLPFVVLSSVMKYAICSSIIGLLILIGTTPLCQGGILSVDLMVPIVAFCLQFLVYVRNFLPFECNSSFPYPKHKK